jgi:hypothetical protein
LISSGQQTHLPAQYAKLAEKYNPGAIPMATITFDTLKFANKLKSAGVPDKQAEAEAEALSEALEVNLKELVTKEYLDTKFQQELAPIHTDLAVLKWMIGLMLAGVISLVLKAFF